MHLMKLKLSCNCSLLPALHLLPTIVPSHVFQINLINTNSITVFEGSFVYKKEMIKLWYIYKPISYYEMWMLPQADRLIR